MKVLSIGTERKLFEDDSAVLARSVQYAQNMEESHIIVFSLKKQNFKIRQVGNLYLYPTNSLFRICYIFDAYKIAKRIIKERKFMIGDSVISSQDPFENGLVGYFLAKKFNFPLQIQLHTDPWSPYFKKSLLNIFRVIIAGFLIPKVQGLRVVSETVAKSMKKNFPNLKTQPQVLPVFIDIEKEDGGLDLKKTFPDFSHIILMASRITKEKDIKTAVISMKKVIEEFPSAGLVIAGNGPEQHKLEKLVKKIGLSKNIIFIGWQNNLSSLFKSADIFLVTSIYEGYGMTLVESAFFGCPIVTTDVGVSRELFRNGENAFICGVGDHNCISSKILELIKDEVKRELFKDGARDSIKRIILPKEEYIKKYIYFLENLLNK